MAPGFADGTVEADNFTVILNLPDGNAAGIPDPALGNTAYGRQNNARGNMFFPAELFDSL